MGTLGSDRLLAQTYFTFNYLPNEATASAYLHRLLGNLPAAPQQKSPDLLCQILQDKVYDLGVREVVIPLSAGKDSRSVLGAAMEVFGPRNITCVTVGMPGLTEREVAQQTCKIAGATWHGIDPNTLTWDADRIRSTALDMWLRHGTVGSVDTIVMMGAVADFAGERTTLFGYLGDATTGAHLPVAPCFSHLDYARALTNFRAKVLPTVPDEITTPLVAFLERHLHLIKDLPGASPFDILDLGFRQGCYIRASLMSQTQNALAPFEDQRWVSHWMTRPLADRHNQRGYATEMNAAFPTTFAARQISRPAYWLRAAIRRVSQFVGIRSPLQGIPYLARERGDPRMNPSMALFLSTTLGAYDRRGIGDPISPSFSQFMAEGGKTRFTRSLGAASLECYLSARDAVVIPSSDEIRPAPGTSPNRVCDADQAIAARAAAP